MKLLLVLASFVALCSSSAIPVVPGDNSNYVEGESRYVWMPDGEGVPQLVDLHEPVDERLLMSRNGVRNQYWLYTRQNRVGYQLLISGNTDSIRNSNYRVAHPTYVIIHGWNNNGQSSVNTMIRDALLAVVDCNVIVVDWRATANSGYNTAAAGVPSVGQHLGTFLVWIFVNFGGAWNRFHIIGYSLGAHVAGAAGRAAGRRPRITGLDPAGPGWVSNSQRLTANSGSYVEAIHTDGGLLGIFNRVADADFYPNGGRNPQPGCVISTCSHRRSFQLFAATVRNRHLVGRRCTNLTQARNNQCNANGWLCMGTSSLTKARTDNRQSVAILTVHKQI